MSKMDNIKPLTDALLKYRSDYDNDGADYSVTQLIDHPRVVHLSKRYADLIKLRPVDPKRELDSFDGTALHKMFEKCLRDDLRYNIEQRLVITCRDRRISGCPDIYDIIDCHLYDLKKAKAYKKVFDDLFSWEQQLNIYAYFLRVKGKRVDRISIIAWWKDFAEKNKKDNPKYPREQIEEIELELWDREEQGTFIIDKVTMMVSLENVPDKELPECTAKDRWDRETVWAVYKLDKSGKKFKKSSRNLSSEKDALLWAKKNLRGIKYEIEHRPGGRERCENWCLVSEYCSQHQEYLKELKGGKNEESNS